jgi:type II secretory pathway predicted ATPase ExeA
VSPFSLTPDPRFYYRSRSHGRVFDLLSSALVRREALLLVAGDLGVGKTTLCRTLIDLQHRKTREALVGNALLSPTDLTGSCSKTCARWHPTKPIRRNWRNWIASSYLSGSIASWPTCAPPETPRW